MIISSLTGSPLLDAEEFAAAARARFGEHCSVDTVEAGVHTDVSVNVVPPGEPGFMVDHDERGDAVRVDGTAIQNAEVAAWVRSLLPREFPRVIAFEDGWAWHVELVHGITRDLVLSEHISHEDPDWSAGDPDLS